MLDKNNFHNNNSNKIELNNESMSDTAEISLSEYRLTETPKFPPSDSNITHSNKNSFKHFLNNFKKRLSTKILVSNIKREMSTDDLICLHCFNKFHQNDVMFRKKDGELEYDNLNYKQIYSINPDAIALKQKKVIDWHHYHQESLVVRQDIIEGIWDDGEMVTQKICPFCHFDIDDLGDTIPMKISGVTCNPETLLNNSWANFISKFSTGINAYNNISMKPWKKEYGRFDGYEITNSQNTVYHNLMLFDRFINEADHKSKLMDICDYATLIISSNIVSSNNTFHNDFHVDTTSFINDFIKKYGDENSTFSRPILIFMDLNHCKLNENFDFSEYMSENNKPILNLLNNHFSNYSIYPIDLSSSEYDVSIKNLLEWIISQNNV